ncbi:MAG: signal peptidase I [bacterium]
MTRQRRSAEKGKSSLTEATLKTSLLRVITSWAREIVVIILIVTVLQVGLVQAYHVPTGSMEPTIMTGDFLIADKVTLGPRTPQWIGVPYTNFGMPVPAFKFPGLRRVHHNDVVVVEVPVDEKTPYVKRVVAVGGQTVEVHDKQLYVDSERQEESWVVHSDPNTFVSGVHHYGIPAWLGNRDNWGPYRVPQGSLFLMGDNRDESFDSRYFGPVKESDVIGRARVTTFTLDLKSAGKSPHDRFSLARFGRVLN